MVDTRLVLKVGAVAAATIAIAWAATSQSQLQPDWPAAIARAAAHQPQARILVLDVATGKLLAAAGLSEAARTLAAPGSTLKPIAMYGLVAARRWDPSRRIGCDRKLKIAARSLNCSHPPADPMDGRQALAWSCNTYFAAVGGSLRRGDLHRLLEETGLLGLTRLSTAEAAAEFREPRTAAENQLELLGVEGIRVSPLELAVAYRWLAQAVNAHAGTSAARVVAAGLADSATYGIAGAASLAGVSVAGKTGTANRGPGTPSHGWFAGWAPAARPSVVIVVYLPTGHGADAARVAADVLAGGLLRPGNP